jgi:hypothetical protein
MQYGAGAVFILNLFAYAQAQILQSEEFISEK